MTNGIKNKEYFIHSALSVEANWLGIMFFIIKTVFMMVKSFSTVLIFSFKCQKQRANEPKMIIVSPCFLNQSILIPLLD